MITFRPLGEESFDFVGRKKNFKFSTISAVRAQGLLNDGCSGFLVSVASINEQYPSTVKEVLVVREYLEVFPEDLPRLPPDREIEFVIDVYPGTKPISRSPYRMAPVELKRLQI